MLHLKNRGGGRVFDAFRGGRSIGIRANFYLYFAFNVFYSMFEPASFPKLSLHDLASNETGVGGAGDGVERGRADGNCAREENPERG